MPYGCTLGIKLVKSKQLKSNKNGKRTIISIAVN